MFALDTLDHRFLVAGDGNDPDARLLAVLANATPAEVALILAAPAMAAAIRTMVEEVGGIDNVGPTLLPLVAALPKEVGDG